MALLSAVTQLTATVGVAIDMKVGMRMRTGMGRRRGRRRGRKRGRVEGMWQVLTHQTAAGLDFWRVLDTVLSQQQAVHPLPLPGQLKVPPLALLI